MTDEHDDEQEHDEEVGTHEAGDDTEQDHATERDRVTSPMQDFSTSQVTTGFVVLLVGVAIAYLLPSLV